MITVGAPGAFLHSPMTTGCPAVGWIVAGTPILSSEALSHSAARLVSSLCSDLALTLGIRRNSNSSVRMRASLSVRNFSRSAGIDEVVIVFDSLVFSPSGNRCDQQGGSPDIQLTTARTAPMPANVAPRQSAVLRTT